MVIATNKKFKFNGKVLTVPNTKTVLIINQYDWSCCSEFYDYLSLFENYGYLAKCCLDDHL